MDAPLRIGFIGHGRHAQANLYPALDALGVTLTSIATRDGDAATAAARRHGATRGHGSYETMLSEDSLDAVIISVGPDDHVGVVAAALGAGVDVFVEKPLGMYRAEAAAIAGLADDLGRIVEVGFMKRFAPAYERMAGAIRDEATMGRPVSFLANFGFTPWTTELRNDTYLRFGAIHIVDLISSLFGDVVDISGATNSVGSEIAMVWSLRCASGVVGALHCTGVPAWGREREELTVTCTQGYVRSEDLTRVRFHVDQPANDPAARWQTLDEATVEIESINSPASGGRRDLYLRGFVGELDHFLQCVRDRTEPRSSARTNVVTTDLCDRLLAALG